MDFSLSYDLTADGDGGLAFGFALGTAGSVNAPEPASWTMLLTACGLLGWLVTRRKRAGSTAARHG
jgi:hypothetical protein